MNNMSSYCGLVDAKIRASDKDLPVPHSNFDVCSDRDRLKILGENENTVFFKLTYITPYKI